MTQNRGLTCDICVFSGSLCFAVEFIYLMTSVSSLFCCMEFVLLAAFDQTSHMRKALLWRLVDIISYHRHLVGTDE